MCRNASAAGRPGDPGGARSQATTSPTDTEQTDAADAIGPASENEPEPEPAAPGEGETVSAQKIAPELDDDGRRTMYNDVTALMEHRETITHVDVISGLTKYKLTSLNPSTVRGLRDSIVEVSDLRDEPPPWDVVLAICASDLDYASCAIPVGANRLRLRPLHPFESELTDEDRDPSSGVREVEVDPELFGIVDRLVRKAKQPDKMTTPRLRFDENPYIPYGRHLGLGRRAAKR